MDHPPPSSTGLSGSRRRCLRAVLAADIENFGGLVSVDETNALDSVWTTRQIAREELAVHRGWLFGLPGDGIFALFESAVDAVRCALITQSRLTSTPKLRTRLRVGVHLGEVLFQDELPFGETLVIATRLESLADPGGILVSSAVMDAVAPRVSAVFCERGVFSLKHSPRRMLTFSVSPLPGSGMNETASTAEPLDRTVLSVLPYRAVASDGAPVTTVVVEPRVTSLPKATPLVIPRAPTSEPKSEPAIPTPSSPGTVGLVLPQPCLEELTKALAVHLGPVARLLIERHSARLADMAALIDMLAREIPSEVERPRFLTQAHRIVARQRG